MSMQKVVERILSDAEKDAEKTLKNAQAKADEIVATAQAEIKADREAVEIEVEAKKKSVFEKRSADARLESSKILLGEKRKTISAVYDLALARLNALEKEDCLALASRLLEDYAEKGDKLYFAENFSYAKEVASLPVVKAKDLDVQSDRLAFSGGMRLVGEKSDKDLSYSALLEADKDENQADLAVKLFK